MLDSVHTEPQSGLHYLMFFFFIVSVPGSIKDGNLEHIMDFYPEDNNSLQISFKKGFRDLFVYLSEKSTRVDLSC